MDDRTLKIWREVEEALGESEICARCKTTLDAMHEKCEILSRHVCNALDIDVQAGELIHEGEYIYFICEKVEESCEDDDCEDNAA